MKLTRILIFGAVVFLSATVSYSQTDNPLAIKKFGVGIHIEHYKLIDREISDYEPSNKIVLTVSPKHWLRIEPEFGFKIRNQEIDDTRSNEFYFGLGAFWMKQYNRIYVYGGIRAEYASYTDEYLQYLSPPVSVIIKHKRHRYKFGPTVGCEYFLTDRFSIGGEIGVKYGYYMYTRDPRPEGYTDTRIHYFTSDNGLLIRFYF